MIYIKRNISNFSLDKGTLDKAVTRTVKDFDYESFQNSYSVPVLNLPNKFRNWGVGNLRYNTVGGALGYGALLLSGALPAAAFASIPYDVVKYLKDDQEKYFPKASKVDKMDEKLKREIQKRIPGYNIKGGKLTKQEKNWLINRANEHYMDLID